MESPAVPARPDAAEGAAAYQEGWTAGYVARDDQIRAERSAGEEPPPPFRTGPTRDVTLDELVPGAIIARYTEPSRGHRLKTRAPCCSRPLRLHGYDILEPVQQAGCGPCGTLYLVELHDEQDGGYLAIFTVQDLRLVTTSHPR